MADDTNPVMPVNLMALICLSTADVKETLICTAVFHAIILPPMPFEMGVIDRVHPNRVIHREPPSGTRHEHTDSQYYHKEAGDADLPFQ